MQSSATCHRRHRHPGSRRQNSSSRRSRALSGRTRACRRDATCRRNRCHSRSSGRIPRSSAFPSCRLIPVARNDDDRERRADWDAAGIGTRRGPPCNLPARANCVNNAPSLARRSMFGVGWPERHAATRIRTDIVRANVVGHQHNDVGLLLRGRRSACHRHGGKRCQLGRARCFWPCSSIISSL